MSFRRNLVGAAKLSTCVAALVLASTAQADTLRDALVAVYNTNPTLEGARASQRATDEDVNVQRAQGLPSATATTTHIEFLRRSANSFTAPERNLGVNAQLQVPIYSGGAVRNGVNAAQERVSAGQADLRATESSIFSQAVAAYMDVLRTEALTELATNQVEVLRVTFQSTNDRFEIGDLTRTDVAQAASRLAVAEGDLRSAYANQINAREVYIQLVGQAPMGLEAPPPLPGLPETVGMAVVTALENNPDLIAAKERADAAGYDYEVAGAGRLPTIGLFANYDYSNFFGTLGGPVASNFAQTESTANAGVRITIPIFQGGLPAARQRQAGARESAALEQVIATERNVIQQTRSAYSSWQASNAVIASSQAAVEAAELSLEGVRAENSIGNRTIIDVLNAEQELLSARAQLVTARRNAYVAGFSLLAAMGKAEARDLNLDTGGPLYDPQVNSDRVDGRFWDWDRDSEPSPNSTRTVDIDAGEDLIGPVLEP
ncbi:TolC family outer membrane protein [uncultured Erythrobacter sp.]|uniref:TolC family outer membrane protein n=1 Tax=uncultured Erythrobacter sp. TaxID=263913 RepID=UPI002629E2E4|nr:TolC family outer membrane protein [uncultured Erythrobacter sp.]